MYYVTVTSFNLRCSSISKGLRGPSVLFTDWVNDNVFKQLLF